ncbi:MAG: nucleoside-diphosphate kinase [bacterium]
MSIERTLLNIYLPALERSITGDILSMIRFMPELDTQLKIIGVNVYALTSELAKELCKTLPRKMRGEDKEIQNRFKEMLTSERNYDKRKYNFKRLFNVVIEGEDAVATVNHIVGDVRIRNGISIMGRYGFCKQSTMGEILYVEFPVSAPSSVQEAEDQINLLWNRYKSLGGPLKDGIVYPEDKKDKVNCSVVIIKPNVFNDPHDPRVGNVINAISRAGMYIIGAKVQVFNREQAEEFYATHKGKHFYEELVNFMSGGESLALLYEGINAIKEIRNTALAVIREAYSDSLTENTVHTSENKEDFEREYRVINFENNQLPQR